MKKGAVFFAKGVCPETWEPKIKVKTKHKCLKPKNHRYKKLLRRFWIKTTNATQKYRLALLKDYSTIKVKSSDNLLLRNEFNHRFYNLYNQCFICKKTDNLIRHHIFALKNGGDNSSKNIISLCNDCHAEIHDWLKTDR